MQDYLLKIKEKLKLFIPSRRLNPHIYWNRLLIGFFFIIALLVIFSFCVLLRIKKQQPFQIVPADNGNNSLIDEKLLKKVSDSFEIKKVKIQEIESGARVYKDPSLK